MTEEHRTTQPAHTRNLDRVDLSLAPDCHVIGLRQKQKTIVAKHPAAGHQRVAMIIVSESSTEATRPVRTGRSIPARSRSSAVHNDTPKHADARPIRVHTEVVAGVSVPSRVPGIVPRVVRPSDTSTLTSGQRAIQLQSRIARFARCIGHG
jgi:hypothetical protein